MKNPVLAVGLALSAAGCAPVMPGTLMMECTEYIGQPITRRIAAFGAPTTVIRISPTEVGYTFKTKETAVVGGHIYYTPNYMVGVDVNRTPAYLATTTCRGTYIVHAPLDTMPPHERIIVDVRP